MRRQPSRFFVILLLALVGSVGNSSVPAFADSVSSDAPHEVAALFSTKNLSSKENDPNRRKFLAQIGLGLVYKLSQKFGNLAGAIRLRGGRLKRDVETYALLKTMLRPGDILFEKMGGALTDKFIPGRLGHVAIYMGTGEELANLGFPVERPGPDTDEDYLSNYHRPWVVEALRSDVQVNSLAHFMNIDELFVLRPQYANADEVRRTINRALHYVGAPYDFLFDLKNDSEIYCTELVTRALPQYDWSLRKRLGIYTIDVDTLLIQAMTRMGFDPVAVVYDRVFYRETASELRTRIERVFRIHSDGTPIDPPKTKPIDPSAEK